MDSQDKGAFRTQRKGMEYLHSKADLLGEMGLPEPRYVDESIIKVARFDVTFEQIF